MRAGWEIVVDGDYATIRPLDVADLGAVAAELIEKLGPGVTKTVTAHTGLAFEIPADKVSLFAGETAAAEPVKRTRVAKKKTADAEIVTVDF